MTGGDIDFSKPYRGGIEWNVQVEPPSARDSATAFKPGETPTWIYPRVHDAALVRTPDGAAEKYLFYRGVGNFTLPVTFTLPDDRTVLIQNTSKEAIPALLIFERPEFSPRAILRVLDPLAAGESRTVALVEPAAGVDWRQEVYATMRATLVKAGLFPAEADGMVQTWWNSYFERPGLRVFWIVPQGMTEAVLPLDVAPAPRQQTRVLVGRSELLTPSFEYALLNHFALGANNPLQSDRLFLAYQARVEALKRQR